MTATIQTIRTAAAACMFAAFLTGTMAPGYASAHPETGFQWYRNGHGPQIGEFHVQRNADNPRNSIVITWNQAHFHSEIGSGHYQIVDYRIFVRDAQEEQLDPETCAINRPDRHPPDGCVRRIVSPRGESYSETITGLRPDRTYYVWVQVNGLYRYNSLQQWQVRGYSANPRRKTITTLPAPSQTTPTPTPTAGHTHDYAAPGHSHSVPDHSHPVANHRHGYAAAQHTHSYAPADHTHAAGTGETTPAPAAAPGSSQTCPRFVELEDTWSGVSEYKENDGSVWLQ